MADSHADIQKHVAIYIKVFAALASLTVITVAASYVHMGHGGNIALAMVIAVVKASLVACYFMHLIDERSLIRWILIICAVSAAILLLVPSLTVHDMVTFPG